jgi:hypothetical protein
LIDNGNGQVEKEPVRFQNNILTNLNYEIMATETQSNGKTSEASGKSAVGLHKGRKVDGRSMNSIQTKSRQKEGELEDENPNSLSKLFERELKSIYSVEKQLLKAFPEIAKACGAPGENIQPHTY